MTFYTINTCRSFFTYIRAAGGLLSYIASRHFSSPHVSYILPVTFFFLQPPGYSIYIEPSIESMPFYVDWSFSFFFFSISYIQRQYVGASLLDDRLFFFYFHSFRLLLFFECIRPTLYIWVLVLRPFGCNIYVLLASRFLFFTLWLPRAWSAGWLLPLLYHPSWVLRSIWQWRLANYSPLCNTNAARLLITYSPRVTG